jgi:hypothetical protein
MSAATILFLAVRILHVGLAALWVGSTAFVVFFVIPALKDAGTAASPMMGAIARRGIAGYMGALGGIAVLSGFWLYWRLTGGFQPALSATHAAMVFGTGGMLAIIAVILGGAVVGRSANKMGALGGKAMALPEGPERAKLMAQSNAARDRWLTTGRILLVLQIIILALMTIGHYV